MFRRLKCDGLIILLLLNSLIGSSVIAAPNNLIKENGSILELQNHILTLEDRTASLTPTEVWAKLSDFKSPGRNELTHGYTNSAIWVLFDVENNSNEENLELAANYPVVNIETYSVYKLPNVSFVRESPIDRRTPSTNLHVGKGTRQTFLVRVTSSQFLNIQFKISTASAIEAGESFENMLFAMLFGCFSTAFITNFLMFLNLRQRGYLFYLFFSFVNCHLMFLAIKFPANILSWGNLDWAHLVHPYSTLGPFTTFLFVRHFLQTRIDFPRLDAAMRLFMFGLVVIAALELFSYSPAYPAFADMYYQIGIILLIVAGISSYRNGFIPSRYYLASLVCFLAGIVTFLTLTFGYLPSNIFTLNSLVIGQTAEMLLMSLALSSKVKIIERESDQSQMKSQLLKIIAHDIATPLSIIKMSAQFVKVIGHERSRDQIMKASDSIENLIHYVHERHLIDPIKNVKLSNISLNDVFNEVEFSYKDRAETKGIKLTFTKNSPDIFVYAHFSNLAQQVLGNLVSNAIKFTRTNGEIVVRAYIKRRNRIAIEIVDQGKGMQKSTVDNLLLQTDRNSSEDGTNGEKGFGYGLSIVKESLRNFKGTLEISSVCENDNPSSSGTTVTILLRRGRHLIAMNSEAKSSTIRIVNPLLSRIASSKSVTE